MTDTKLPDTMVIPTEEEERPVKVFNNFVLTHDIKHCRPRHLWPSGHAQIKEEWVEPIERYLAAFADPIRTVANEILCPACGEQVTGYNAGVSHWKHMSKLTYSPEGTMEGRCTSCGYPCRLKHEIRSSDGQMLVQLVEFPLFYHPSATQQTN